MPESSMSMVNTPNAAAANCQRLNRNTLVRATLPCVIRTCIATLPGVNAKSPSSRRQLVPDSLAIADALDQSAPLALLRQRLRDSNARYAAIHGLLPAALARHVT